MMKRRPFKIVSLLITALAFSLATARLAMCDGGQEGASSNRTEIFNGEPRLLLVHGYSTSAHWWAFLQRKIDRYMGGPGDRVVEVRRCIKGGTPIAKWMNVQTGERSDAWKQVLTPILQKGERPVVILAQQSLQWVYGDRTDGIRHAEDRQRIQQGADAISRYGTLLLKDGAADVYIAMHIYKHAMEPEIGNEKLALSELMTHRPPRLHAGPDVWKPTKAHFPLAFDRDRQHPNFVGAEIMAHYWFVTLLQHDGREVPAWSSREMEAAIANTPHGLTRNGMTFRRLLDEWKITSR